LHERATPRLAADFLRRLIERVPYRIHTVLTDNGFQFMPPRGGWSVGEIQQLLATHRPFRAHAFDFACAQQAIEHRLTKFNHPWTNGQVERMNRTIKDATVRRFYYETHDSLRAHLATFLEAYNFAKRLKSLRGLTPFERICQLWTEQPERFRLNPIHHMPGLNIFSSPTEPRAVTPRVCRPRLLSFARSHLIRPSVFGQKRPLIYQWLLPSTSICKGLSLLRGAEEVSWSHPAF
jgi:hypothetical protein